MLAKSTAYLPITLVTHKRRGFAIIAKGNSFYVLQNEKSAIKKCDSLFVSHSQASCTIK